jgi:hypothetical protein
MPKKVMRRTSHSKAGATKKPWTVLVWIAGDNNLASYGVTDMKEMKKIGSTPDLNIVTQYDRSGSKGTERYFLRKGTSLGADVVPPSLGETNTGDPQVAIDFFTWGIKNYPSDRLMIVIWNHGSGLDETDLYKRARRLKLRVYRGDENGDLPRGRLRQIASSHFRRALFSTSVDRAIRTRGIAYDDTNRDFLDNVELKRVLQKAAKAHGRPIDVFGMDACLMNMIEVTYQLRGLVSNIVASQELEPGDGWPYDKVLGDLATKPAASGADVAKKITARYLASYTASDAVTSGAVDVTRVEAAAKAVDTLASACIAVMGDDGEYAAFSKALTSSQRFDTKDFVDLGDFAAQIATRSGNTAVKQACKGVLAALTGGASPLVLAEGHKGAGLSRATGTSIYFPTAGDAQVTYANLDFAKATRWGKLIARFQSA